MTNLERFVEWLGCHDMAEFASDVRDGLFRKGAIPCVLPYLRAYWAKSRRREGQGSSDDANVTSTVDRDRSPDSPNWKPHTWKPCADGSARFLRADQALDMIFSDDSLLLSADERSARLRSFLRAWLVPVDETLAERPDILSRRVEAIRVSTGEKGLWWSRRPRMFPDAFRWTVVGLDVVHTPENARAGLTRYLCDGWSVDDDGSLVSTEAHASRWGPSTSHIPHRLYDAPRRLMVGASMRSRAVDLEKRTGDPEGLIHRRPLRTLFSTYLGLTHEDAIVLSRGASEKLRYWSVRNLDIQIPSVATRVETLVSEGDAVARGQLLARAYIDLFALGFRRYDAEVLDSPDGWVEVALPAARSPFAGELLSISRVSRWTQKYRETLSFAIQERPAVSIGDKLATCHGIKGVVSAIVEDDAMPEIAAGRAEIIFSPVGTARRGAMGQFKEADPVAATPGASGTVDVVRQPQDSAPRCRVRGTMESNVRGQRYGEMEFWALMAHGASAVAKELLSADRSTSRWMEWERRVESGSEQELSRRALNRYFAVLGLHLNAQARFVAAEPSRFHPLPCRTRGDLDDAKDLLLDSMRFARLGGLCAIPLREPLEISFQDVLLRLERVYVVPPWLRPVSAGQLHRLTKAYRWLIRDVVYERDPTKSVGRCLELALDQKLGAGGFLRREILGRRLTRSARAVIVPRPELRVDQIALPEDVAELLFEGLPAKSRDIVLVNRNPTLHRRGLVALRPVIDSTGARVFGLPLGLLSALGADFDGDQVAVVALETPEAIKDAERLLPGAESMRTDPFRPGRPAFPLLREMAVVREECELAAASELTQDQWCRKHSKLLSRRIAELGDGWGSDALRRALEDNASLWNGLSEDEWFERASIDMEKVFSSVRKKGQLGGVLRRQFYRRSYSDDASFWTAVAAVQTVTERFVQSALSVKSGPGVKNFRPSVYFEDPNKPSARESVVKKLDSTLDPSLLADALGVSVEPTDFLSWLAQPTAKTLMGLRAELLETITQSVQATVRSSELSIQSAEPFNPNTKVPNRDPRLLWFFLDPESGGKRLGK